MKDINQAVDLWLSAVGKEDAFLIYVHGKGDGEPTETLGELAELIGWYGVRPLVLHWRPCGGGWPDDGAEAAGPALVTLLENLKTRRPQPTKPVVLLGQSMGNFAIQYVGKSVQKGRLDLPANLLKTVVLSAAAIEAKNHHVWLQILAQKAETYVVINEDDNILQLADVFKLRKPLGRKLNGVTLANNVTYIDLSGLRKGFHRYYRPDSKEVPPNVKAFYGRVLRGATPNLSRFPLVRGQIRQLN
jgi:hypothetical protein